MDINDIYTPVGCNECYHGYKGRIALQEVLVINQEIRDAITNNTRKEDLRKLVYVKDETSTLLEDGLMKVMNGLTSFEEILRVIDIDDDLGAEETDIKAALMGKTKHPIPTFINQENKNIQDIEIL